MNTTTIGAVPAVAGTDAFAHENEDTVLVVVDMQAHFTTALDERTQQNVAREIRRAKQLGLAIIVVEYDPADCGKTFTCLLDLLKGYERHTVVTKSTSDGSAEVIEACKDEGYWVESYRICGVNSDACVLETVQGLLPRIPTCEITVVRDACNAPAGDQNDVWTDDYPKMERVHVLA